MSQCHGNVTMPWKCHNAMEMSQCHGDVTYSRELPEFLEGLTASGLRENIHRENLCSFTLNCESFPVNYV